jgi:hypothetical protein
MMRAQCDMRVNDLLQLGAATDAHAPRSAPRTPGVGTGIPVAYLRHAGAALPGIAPCHNVAISRSYNSPKIQELIGGS